MIANLSIRPMVRQPEYLGEPVTLIVTALVTIGKFIASGLVDSVSKDAKAEIDRRLAALLKKQEEKARIFYAMRDSLQAENQTAKMQGKTLDGVPISQISISSGTQIASVTGTKKPSIAPWIIPGAITLLSVL